MKRERIPMKVEFIPGEKGAVKVVCGFCGRLAPTTAMMDCDRCEEWFCDGACANKHFSAHGVLDAKAGREIDVPNEDATEEDLKAMKIRSVKG